MGFTVRKADFPVTHVRPLPERASVLGLGISGVAAARYLAQQGVKVLASDLGEPAVVDAELVSLGVEVERGKNRILPGSLVVISPGIPPSSPIHREAIRKGQEVISGPELFARSVPVPIIGVTGTDGKSTVTTWIGHLCSVGGLSVAVGGNLGVPMMDYACEGESLDLAVIELSAFQLLSTSTLVPCIAVVTNVVDDHLDYFRGDRDAYRASKRILWELAGEGSTRIALEGSSIISTWPEPAYGRTSWLAQEPGTGIWFSDEGVYWGESILARSSELPLPGKHSIRNGALVAEVGRVLGLKTSVIRRGLLTYRGLPHRTEFVGTYRGRRVYNDSKATSPNATLAAVQSVPDGALVLVGGQCKGSDWETLFGEWAKRNNRVVGFGEFAQRIPRELLCGRFSKMEQAVHFAMSISNRGDTILLSPGCASFDEFGSYRERGERFIALVQEWGAGEPRGS